MYQDLSRRHDWPVNNAIVDLPIKMKGNIPVLKKFAESVGGPGTRIRELTNIDGDGHENVTQLKLK